MVLKVLFISSLFLMLVKLPLAVLLSVPTVIFGPGGEPVYCPDEHLSIDDLIEATQVYAEFAAIALGGGVAS